MKNVAIIGGGAAGMACALALSQHARVTLYERNDRLGKKLSATGNGQGNVTNLNMGVERYFSDDLGKVEGVLSRYGVDEVLAFLKRSGGVFLPDSRGRVYPASRQASAVTDLLRARLNEQGVAVILNAKIQSVSYDNGFLVKGESVHEKADFVALCAGGMASPNFGTDGNGYALAKAFGHTVSECTPSLVQLRCNPATVRGLKGIRVDTGVRVQRNGRQIYAVRGDALFTESGVSGDAIFRASAYVKEGDTLLLDFLPDVEEKEVYSALAKGEDRLLCIVNNGLGRALSRIAGADNGKLVSLVKNFPVTITGSLGFAYAQVTKGGVPMAEVNEHLMSKKRSGLFFAGEILNVDGECGGYNLHWAFASGLAAAEGVKACL